MSTDNFLKRIVQRLKAAKPASQTKPPAHQPDEMMGKLMHMVASTDEIEISCDEVFELLDQYVELEARGENVADLLPLVRRHLERCRDCYEEYEALARAFQATAL